MFCVSEYRLFVKQGYAVHSAIDLGYKNALLLTENVLLIQNLQYLIVLIPHQ